MEHEHSNVVHCKIDEKWYYIKCYKKDYHWYNCETDEIIPNEIIYWVE